jgi:hypothetical protein
MDKFVSSAAVAVIAAALAFLFGIVKSVRESREEKTNITRALLIEIRLLNVAFDKRYNWWIDPGQVDPGKWLPPLVPFATSTFPHLASKIGLLDPKVAQHIVEFHGYVQFINEFQKSQEAHVGKGKSQEFFGRYKGILEEQVRDRGDKLFQQYYTAYGL